MPLTPRPHASAVFPNLRPLRADGNAAAASGVGPRASRGSPEPIKALSPVRRTPAEPYEALAAILTRRNPSRSRAASIAADSKLRPPSRSSFRSRPPPVSVYSSSARSLGSRRYPFHAPSPSHHVARAHRSIAVGTEPCHRVARASRPCPATTTERPESACSRTARPCALRGSPSPLEPLWRARPERPWRRLQRPLPGPPWTGGPSALRLGPRSPRGPASPVATRGRPNWPHQRCPGVFAKTPLCFLEINPLS